MTEGPFSDGIRIFFATLDRAIYSFIQIFYDVMIGLSKISILSIDQINGFASKIYALLAVFMVFKITFSLINYLVNPEKVFDSSKGVQKILVNIVIVLGMIIITPTAFTKLYDVQNAIIDDDVIPKIIMGDITENNRVIVSQLCNSTGVGTVEIKKEGKKFAFLIFRSFYQPEWSRDNPGVSYEEYMKLSDSNKETISNKWLNENNSDAGAYCKSNSVSQLLNVEILNSAPKAFDDMYIIDYQFFVSTVVGIVVLGFIISYCFDIAIRSIRLGFLQLIAPIPIVSYIDPDSGKNGMFKKWLQDVGKTWASLFIRLISIYFAIYLIDLIADNMGTFKDINGNEIVLSYSPVVNIFMIIGILMFAKKLPSLIEGILGIKLDGKFEMNPLKRITNDVLGGKLIGKAGQGAYGLAAGTAATAGTLGKNMMANKFKYKKSMGDSFKDSWADSKKAFSAGVKQHSYWKAMSAGNESLKKQKEEYKTAKREYKKLAKDKSKGSELFDKTIKRDANGVRQTKEKLITNLDGTVSRVRTYDTDDTLAFTNDEYKKSYKNVEDLKKTKIGYENLAKQKAAAYDQAVRQYGADSEEAKVAFQAKVEVDKLASTAGKNYDKAVEEHDKMKKVAKYRQDAEAEELLSYYKATNPNAIYETDNEESSNENNNQNNSNNVNSNNDNNSANSSSGGTPKQQSTDEYREENEKYDSKIEKLNEELSVAQEEERNLSKIDSESAQDRRNEVSRDISRIQQEIQTAELEKIHSRDANPGAAIEDLQHEIETKLNPEVQVATETFNDAEVRLRELAPKLEEDINDPEYMEADRLFDEANEAKKQAESVRDKAQDQIAELQRKINSQVTNNNQNVVDNSNEIKELLSEAAELQKELTEMEDYYGNTNAHISPRGKKILNRLDEIKDQVKKLKR